MLGVAARWRRKKILKLDFLRNGYRYRRGSFAAMCPFGVPIQRPSPLGAEAPHLGVRSPQPKIYIFGPLYLLSIPILFKIGLPQEVPVLLRV